MIIFTSRFDGFVKAFVAIPVFFCIWMGIGFLCKELVLILAPKAEKLSDVISTIGGFVFAIIVMGKFIAIHLYTLSSFLYLRISLKTKVTWKDAQVLAFLFSVNQTGRWYPLKEVKKLPPEKRKIFVYEFAREILKQSKG